MNRQDTIGVVLKASLENFDKVQNDIKEGLNNIGTTDATGTTSASASGTDYANVLKRLQDNPTMKKAIDNFRDALYGLDNASSEQAIKMFEKNGIKHAQAYVKAAMSERRKLAEEMAREGGVPAAVTEQLFDKMYGGFMRDASNMNVNQLSEKDPRFKDHMSNVGKYVVGSIVGQMAQSIGNYLQSEMMANAFTKQVEALGFNYSSLPAQYITKTSAGLEYKLKEAELNKQKYEAIGGLLGGILPIAIGSAFGNPAIGSAISLATGPIGMSIGGYLGTKGITEEQMAQLPERRWMQAVQQLIPIAQERVQAYDRLDINKTRFGARYGDSNVPGAGLGYSPDELYGLAYMQGSVTGKFNPHTFLSQLAYSRAYGLSPQEVFQSSLSTRYTGEEVGANELVARKNLADKTGMGTRFSDLTNAMNNLSQIMTKLGVNPTEQGLFGASLLPNMLYGNTARGRMGDLGMDTLMNVQGIFNQQSGSAGDVFLFNALKGLHKGNLMDFELLKQQGAFNPSVLGETLKYAQGYGDSKMGQYFLMQALGINNPAMSKNFTEKVFGFNEKGYSKGVEGFLQKLEEETKGLAPNSKEMKDKLGQLTGLAEQNTSQAETFHEEILSKMEETGGNISDSIKDFQKKYEETIGKVFGNEKFWDELKVSLEGIPEELKRILDEILEDKRLDKEKNEMKPMGYTQDEKDFVFNMMRRRGDPLHTAATDLFNLEANKGLFESGSNYDELMKKANGEGYVLPIEFDEKGVPTQYVWIRNGFRLDAKDPSKKFYLGNKEEQFEIDKNVYDTYKNMPNYYFEQDRDKTREQNQNSNTPGQPWKEPESDASGGGKVNINLTVNISPDEVDTAAEEVRRKLKEVVEKNSRPRRTTFS